MFNYTSSVGYPGIFLHDCTVTRVRVEGRDVVLELDDGFWIGADNPQNPFGKLHRTDKSELRFVGADLEDCFTAVHNKLHIRGSTTSIRHEVSFASFASKINRGIWRFEAVNEYYTGRSAMLCGYLRRGKYPYYGSEAQLEMRHESLQYSWNKVREDRPW